MTTFGYTTDSGSGSRRRKPQRACRRRALADQLGCGPDVEEHVEKIRPFLVVGFTDVALVQIGEAHQAPFIAWAQDRLLPALRCLRPAG